MSNNFRDVAKMKWDLYSDLGYRLDFWELIVEISYDNGYS